MEILCIGNDITKRMEDEETIRESAERYRTLVESQLELVCVWLPDTTLTFVNQSYCRLMGRSREELIGKRWIEFIPESSRGDVMRNYEGAVAAKQVYSYVHDIETGEGIRWFRWNDVPLFNKDGELVAFQSVGHDITERKLAEDRINALLAEKELTLKEVHHRIKNNMSTVKAMLMMQAESFEDPGAVSALHEAANRVQSMSALYDKLYTSYSYTEMPVYYYLSPLVDEIMANFPGSGTVRVEKSFDDFNLPVTLLQPLGIIINELLTNVMKYAFAGRGDGFVRLSLKKKGGRVKMVIQDNGIGMPDSVDLHSSSGFGMQLVRTLAAQIGARISIERKSGTGFTLDFTV
jgi:PAS domain S-box-containing protein